MRHRLDDRQRVLVIGIGLACLTVGGILYFVFYQETDTYSRLQQTGTLRIGYAVEAPYAFVTPEGDVTGESPEVAKRIAAKIGVRKILWRQAEFNELIPELEAGRIDLIAAGLFITPERAQRVLFSRPTFCVRQGLLVLQGNPKGLHSCGQVISNDEIRIAVLAGSIEERKVRGLAVPDRRLVVVPDALTGRIAVETGAADALALSDPSVRWMAHENQLGRTEAASPFDPYPRAIIGYGAFAFRTKDRRLQRAWNHAQQTFVGSAEHVALLSSFGFYGEGATNLCAAESKERE